MIPSCARLLLALLLGASVGGAARAEPELAEAWLLLGEHDRALRSAQELSAAPDADWRDHAAYIRIAASSHLRWAVVEEYRWLAERHPEQPRIALLADWATVMVASGAELDQALERLASAAQPHGPVGAELLAAGLLRAGEHERAAVVLEGVSGASAAALRVEALVGDGQQRAASDLVGEGLERYPGHPGMAAPLWERGVSPSEVRRGRRRALRAARGLLDADDPVQLLSAWQVLARAKATEDAQRAADGVAAAVPGLLLPPRLPYGTIMLEHLGQGLARTGQGEVSAELTEAERAAVAAVRARTLRDQGLVDQARRAYSEAIALAGGDAQLLLEAAALHLEVEPQGALAWVGQALLLLACEPGLVQPERRAAIARGLELQAASLRALELHDQALGYRMVASLLQPSADGLVELGLMQESQGGTAAALESLALAAALGSARAIAEMERLYRGPASVDALVRAAAADLERWTAFAPVPAGPAGPEPALRGRVLSTSEGDLPLDAEREELLVLVFWASWCAPCAQELPMVDGLQRRWRAQGLPVRVVAISVDQDEADYRRGARRFAELGLTLAWDPALAAALDIEAVPATRLISPEGQQVGRLQGFQEGHDVRLDALVRSLLQP